MRTLIVIAMAGLALATAGAAGSGGFATVGVSPMPPDDAGTPWNVNLKVLQHGRTPLDGVVPMITIRNASTGETKSFTATPTGTSGMYRATVTFPSNGTWTYEINDGFTQTHTFAPVTLSGDGGDSSAPIWAISGAVALGMALLAGLVLFARRRRPRPDLAPTH